MSAVQELIDSKLDKGKRRYLHELKDLEDYSWKAFSDKVEKDILLIADNGHWIYAGATIEWEDATLDDNRPVDLYILTASGLATDQEVSKAQKQEQEQNEQTMKAARKEAYERLKKEFEE